ncbi:MAG: OmpA family protein [Deltaproteobacteria bacterium]|nr:OmpA family protein [Deltaproteobacteria bacterium]
MALQNAWGAPRIHGELKRLGFDVSERTVSRCLRGSRRRPQARQNWLTFLRNHQQAIAAFDLFVVLSSAFKPLYVWFAIEHARRRILHVNVTDHPSATWVVHRLREAFPRDSAPKSLIFDRDSIFSAQVAAAVKAMGTKPIRTAFRCPWQNPIAGRFVGSAHRDLLDHVIIIDQRQLLRLLREYVGTYYLTDRTHLGLEQDTPAGRPLEPRPSPTAKVVSLPRCGGLHHRYVWRLRRADQGAGPPRATCGLTGTQGRNDHRIVGEGLRRLVHGETRPADARGRRWCGRVARVVAALWAVSSCLPRVASEPTPVVAPVPEPTTVDRPQEPDDDGNGVGGSADRCPDLPEDLDGVADDDGCPEAEPTDTDGDRIDDDADRCPLDPELYNGLEDDDGCPDQNVVVVTATCDPLISWLLFAEGTDETAPASAGILDRTAEALERNPQLLLIEVQGHASEASTARRNERLSLRRARAVVAELVRRGIDSGRLLPAGYGSRCAASVGPCDTVLPPDRVDFAILWTDVGPTGVARSCPAGAGLRPALPERFTVPPVTSGTTVVEPPADAPVADRAEAPAVGSVASGAAPPDAAGTLVTCHCLTYPNRAGGVRVTIKDCFATPAECNAAREQRLGGRRDGQPPTPACEVESRPECGQAVFHE